MPHRPAGLKIVRMIRVSRTAVSICCALAAFACAGEKKGSGGGADGVRPVHTLEFEGTGVDLASDGRFLALSARNNGIIVYETTTPERPLQVGAVELPHVYRSLVQGTTVFGLDEMQGLSFLDLRNLNQLQLTQSLSSVELYGYVHDALWVNQTLLFASEAVGLSQFTVDSGFALKGGKISSGSADLPATSLSLLDDLLVSAAFRGTIEIYDWKDGNLRLESSSVVPHQISDLACNSGYCFAAALTKGVSVYSAGAGGKPEFKHELAFAEAVDLVHLDEDLLYVGYLGPRRKNGWYVVDLSDATRPRTIRRIPTAGVVKDFARVGSFTYVLLAEGQILIYDRESLK